MWLVSNWSWGLATSSNSVSGCGLGQHPHALWLPTKATQPTCLCLSLLTSLPSASANHLPTGHLGTGQEAGLLPDTGDIPVHVYLPPPHTHSMGSPHTQRAHQTWGARPCTWIVHTHTEERWPWGRSGEGPAGSSSRRDDLKCP